MMIPAKTKTLLGVVLTGAAVLAGCKKEEPPPPPPPPPAPPPPAPEPVEIAPLLESLSADPRLQFPQDLAPIDGDFASAVIRFGDALVQGDDSAMRPMLDVTGRASLERLLVTGGWYDATGELEAVRVIDLIETGEGGSVTYALQQPGEAYLLEWETSPGPDGGLIFSGVPTPDETRARAVEFAGGGGSAQPASPGGIDALEDVPDEMAALMAIVFGMGNEIAERTNTPNELDDLKDVMAAQMGIDVAQLDAVTSQGRDALDRGVRPPAPVFRMFMDQSLAGLRAAQEAGEDTEGVTEDLIFEVVADVMGISVGDVRALYEEGGS